MTQHCKPLPLLYRFEVAKEEVKYSVEEKMLT